MAAHFAKRNTKNCGGEKRGRAKIPYDFASFRGYLYFLDKKSGEIIRYPYLKNFEWGSAQLWLAKEEKKASGAKSLAVDGSVWLLAKNNSLSRYYAGRLQEEISLEIFPAPKELKKILLRRSPAFGGARRRSSNSEIFAKIGSSLVV